jgi:hypothetical protein
MRKPPAHSQRDSLALCSARCCPTAQRTSFGRSSTRRLARTPTQRTVLRTRIGFVHVLLKSAQQSGRRTADRQVIIVHTHTRVHTHTHTHTHTHPRTHTHARARAHTRTHAHAHAHAHTHTCARALTRSHTRSLARDPPPPHTHTHTRTHSLTQCIMHARMHTYRVRRAAIGRRSSQRSRAFRIRQNDPSRASSSSRSPHRILDRRACDTTRSRPSRHRHWCGQRHSHITRTRCKSGFAVRVTNSNRLTGSPYAAP